MRKAGIKYKLIIITMIVTLGVLTVCGILSSLYFFNILKKQIYQDERQKLNQTAVRIADIQDEMMKMAKIIASDGEIQRIITEENAVGMVEYFSGRQQVTNKLSQYLNIRQDSYSVYILTDQSVYFSNGLETDEDIRQDYWYQEMVGNGFTGVHEIYQMQSKIKTKVVSYRMQFYDMKSGTRALGDIIINLDYEELQYNLGMNDEILEGYWLSDQQGNKIWSYGKIGEDTKNSGRIVRQDYPMPDGWTLSAQISDSGIIYKLRYIFIFFSVLFLAALIVLAAVLWRFMGILLNPIEQLVEGAKEVGNGNFNYLVNIQTEDEFQRLGESFNTMVGDIKNYIDTSIQYEKTAKEMEINRLMLQINPHFIYNTLNSIVFMAQIKGNEDIAIFAKAFISLLQDTLNVDKDKMYISLEQEMTNVKNYLILQSYRYVNRFEVVYDVHEETLSCKVPNVFIQPLVENAVFHGICPKPGKGILKISSRLEEDGNVQITVEDNGAGMTGDQIEALLNTDMKIRGGMRKIGISNIKERIQYIYGENYGMTIESQVEMGTKIVINIPFEPVE